MSANLLHRLKAQKGLQLLIEEHTYSQVEIVRKLKAIDCELSKSSISNLYTEKQGIGSQIWRKAAEGIGKMLEIEHCLIFVEDRESFEPIPHCTKRTIQIEKELVQNPEDFPASTYLIHDGRLDVPEKVALYREAQTEVMEVGIRLRNFTNYFKVVRDTAFENPIRELLDQGVHFKCFVLAPDGNFSRRYFEDRARVQPMEKINAEKSAEILSQLKSHFQKINKEGHRGRLQLFTYDHFPYYHATVIDGETENAQMIISSYLYGLSRANSPVIQLGKKSNKTLFKKYWKSIKELTTHQVTTIIS